MKYQFKKIPDGPVHRAQRFSIFPPLIVDQPARDILFHLPTIRVVLPELRAAWITRVRDLRKAGWGVVSDLGYQYLIECPPSFAYSTERRRQCKRYMVCPFCWCRHVVVPLFRRVESELYLPTRKPANYDLFELVEYEYFTHENNNAADVVSTAIAQLRKYKKCLQDAVGSFHMTTVDPIVSDSEITTDWRLMHRVLAIIRPGMRSRSLPVTERLRLTQRHLMGVDSQTLAAAVGRVCEYPRGMFFGPAEQVVDLLEARGGGRGSTPRLSVHYGALRNSRSDRDGDKKGGAKKQSKRRST